MPRAKALTLCFGLAVVLTALGCGGSSPTSPSGVSGPSGVTLSGSFASANSSSFGLTAFVRTPYDGMTVEVLGTGIQTQVNSNGSFTLRGLPEGSFRLQFKDQSGNPVGSSIPFNGVKPNQEITVVVTLDGGTVRVLEEKRNGIGHGDVELEGLASNIQVSQAHPNQGSLVVDGQVCVTRANETAIRKGNRGLTLRDIRNGDRVHVKGLWEPGSGTGQQVFAQEIKLQEEEETTQAGGCMIDGGKVGAKINLEGNVAGGGMGDFMLKVNGNKATHDVRVRGGELRCNGKKTNPCSLKVGNKVHVKGRLTQCNGSSATVDASEVKVQK